MNKKIILIIIFIFQLAAPLWMIAEREAALIKGVEISMRVAPVDPYDPFRGRYMIINVDNRVNASAEFSVGEAVYATLQKDKNGFHYFDTILKNPPEGSLYISTSVSRKVHSNGEYFIEVPFDRYYLNEEYAPVAESAMMFGGSNPEAYIKLRLLNGKAVLTDLLIDGIPVEEYAKKVIENRRLN